MTEKEINEIINIKESYELPERLMDILLDRKKREHTFAEFLALGTDLSFDWFTDYFQESHSNRANMMQDFTPKEVTALLSDLEPDFKVCADVCSGTGGLTIGAWGKNPNAFFYCEELSTRAFPLLLFNLAIRKMNAVAVNKDVLKNEVYAVYRIENGSIERIDEIPEIKADIVVTNPPYSVKFKWDETIIDKRFEKYGYPPSNASDYGFILHALQLVKENGTVAAILPHGVLFRGSKEEIIRHNLIDNGKLSAVIGLPGKLFLNTSIPTAIIIFKDSPDRSCLFIDASKEYEKGGKQNRLTSDNLEKIKTTYRRRKSLEKYSHLATYEEMEENGFNLNIPRYVDVFEKEELPDITVILEEMIKTNEEIEKTEKELLAMTRQLVTQDLQKRQELDKMIKMWEKSIKKVDGAVNI